MFYVGHSLGSYVSNCDNATKPDIKKLRNASICLAVGVNSTEMAEGGGGGGVSNLGWRVRQVAWGARGSVRGGKSRGRIRGHGCSIGELVGTQGAGVYAGPERPGAKIASHSSLPTEFPGYCRISCCESTYTRERQPRQAEFISFAQQSTQKMELILQWSK